MPGIAWVILGSVALILVILGVFLALRMGAQPAVPAPTRTPTSVPPSLTAVAPPLLPVPSVPSLTPRPASTATPSATATATSTVPKPTLAFVKYRVRPGDTLSTIAEEHRVSTRSIMLANGLRNDVIFVGQELIIPLPTPHP